MSFGSLLICCKLHKTLTWLPRPINNAIQLTAAVNRKQPCLHHPTIQQHLFLLNNRQPGSICTGSGKAGWRRRRHKRPAQVPRPRGAVARGGLLNTHPRPRNRRLRGGVWRLEVWPIGGGNPICQMLQRRAVLWCSPSYEILVFCTCGNEALRSDAEPASRGRPGARTQLSTVAGAPATRYRATVLFSSLREGMGSWPGGRQWPRGTLGNANPGPSPDSPGALPLLRAHPQEKARAGSRPTGLQIKDWQRWDSAGVRLCRTAFSPYYQPRRHGPPPPPHSASPATRPPQGLSPRGQGTLPPQRRPSPVSPRRREPAAALASRGWRTQTSTNQKKLSAKRCRNFRGEDGRIPAPSSGFK